jgi:hypothetical protein
MTLQSANLFHFNKIKNTFEQRPKQEIVKSAKTISTFKLTMMNKKKKEWARGRQPVLLLLRFNFLFSPFRLHVCVCVCNCDDARGATTLHRVFRTLGRKRYEQTSPRPVHSTPPFFSRFRLSCFSSFFFCLVSTRRSMLWTVCECVCADPRHAHRLID